MTWSPARFWLGSLLAASFGAASVGAAPPGAGSSSGNGNHAAPAPSMAVATARFAGTASCLARGCHGGVEVAPDGSLAAATLANAATVWINHDRHRLAYRALEHARSRAILQRLHDAAPGDWPLQDPTREVRCLACHTTPALADAALNDVGGVSELRAEGVSCDACHTTSGGDSWRWVDSHGRGELKQCYDDPQRGLRQLATAAQRASVCVGCHVGAPADEATATPLRDMNHDMIAAGHPRLFFDYATYIQLMPPHWRETPQPTQTLAPFDATGELAAGVIGEVATFDAELRLLQDRATRATPWPEFATWDCFACHHDLRWPTWRQHADGSRSVGRLAWVGPRGLAPSQSWLIPPGTTADALTGAEASLQRFSPPTNEDSSKLQNWTNAWLTTRAGAQLPASPSDVTALLPPWPARVPGDADRKDSFADLSWDEAARYYYWAREAERVRRSPVTLPRTSRDAEIDDAFQSLFDTLTIRTAETGVDSPRDYEPQLAAQRYMMVRELMLERWERVAK